MTAQAGHCEPPGGPVPLRGDCGHVWELTYRRVRAIEAREYAHRRTTTCPHCRRVVVVEALYAERMCASPRCSNPLSRHNPGPECWSCDAEKAKRRAAQVAAA